MDTGFRRDAPSSSPVPPFVTPGVSLVTPAKAGV